MSFIVKKYRAIRFRRASGKITHGIITAKNGDGTVNIRSGSGNNIASVPIATVSRTGRVFADATLISSGPAFRAASSTTTTSSTMTCAMPTGTTTGDILVMTVWGFYDPKAGTFPTDPSGWTSRATATSTSNDGYFWRVFTKTAGASESSVTQAGTNWSAGSMTVIAVSGGTAVDVVGTIGGGFGGPNLVAPSVTTTTATDLLIGTWVAEKTLTAQAITAPATMTSRVTTSVTNSYILTSNVATQTLSASGATGTRTATIPLLADFSYYVLLAVK